VRRRLDIRRIPLGLLFLLATVAIFLYLVRIYLWLLHYNVGAFFLHSLTLIPVAMFFAALVTLILWYLFRILLPGITRYRKLRMIRYQRSLRRRAYDKDLDPSQR